MTEKEKVELVSKYLRERGFCPDFYLIFWTGTQWVATDGIKVEPLTEPLEEELPIPIEIDPLTDVIVVNEDTEQFLEIASYVEEIVGRCRDEGAQRVHN